MDAREAVRQIRRTLHAARPMPMSASVVVNRRQLLALVERLDQALPHPAGADGHPSAESIAAVQAERERLVDDTEIVRDAHRRAEEMLTEARTEAVELRRETDDYVDTKLANLQIALTKTLEALNRGRDRLHGRSDLGNLGADPDEDLRIPSDP